MTENGLLYVYIKFFKQIRKKAKKKKKRTQEDELRNTKLMGHEQTWNLKTRMSLEDTTVWQLKLWNHRNQE